MKLSTGSMFALALLGASGCATDRAADGNDRSAAATLRDAANQVLAEARATEVGDGVRIRIEAVGMPSGGFGAHVHTTGTCTAPDFASAGPHWNPSGRQHGKDNPQGMHMGDLPNLQVGADGRGSIEYVIPNARLRSGANPLLDADGAAIVVHAAPDDYRTDPSGSSGARTACGVLA
jgi:superoxide dismutase, Cu-Zn family